MYDPKLTQPPILGRYGQRYGGYVSFEVWTRVRSPGIWVCLFLRVPTFSLVERDARNNTHFWGPLF